MWLGGLLWKVPVIVLGLVAADRLSQWSEPTWQAIGIGLLLFSMLLERSAARDSLARVDEILLGRLEAAEFLADRAPGTAGAFTLTGVPNAFDRLMDELLAAEADPLAKEVDATAAPSTAPAAPTREDLRREGEQTPSTQACRA